MSLYSEDARSPWAIIESECDCRLCTDERQPCRDCGAPKDRDGNLCDDCRADRRAASCNCAGCSEATGWERMD